MLQKLVATFIVLLSLSTSIQSVRVQFNVNQVPKYYTPFNEDIYIAGSFNNWSPNTQKLTRINKDLYRVELDLAVGTHQFKFTRGSWANVECNSDGSFAPNRQLQVTSTTSSHVALIYNWDDFKGRHTAVGNVHIIHSKFPYPQFNTVKRIWIYLPPDYYTSTTKTYPVVYMSDAQNLYDDYTSFAGEWGVDESMESEHQAGRVASIIVGLETTSERMAELTPHNNPSYASSGQGDKYVDFLINTLKPYIDSNYRTKPQREFTAIAGSSLGGLMSFYAGIKNQRVFSKIGVFSPSFWFSSQIYSMMVNENIPLYADTRLYFVCGTGESSTMASDMERMVNLLRTIGYRNIQSVNKTDGQHSEWFWRREFPAAYRYLFQ